MAREIQLDQVADMPEAVHAAVAELEAGKLVLLPDETGWNLVGLAIAEQAGKALSQVAGGSDSLLPALNLPDPAMVRDYLREPTPLFQKLAARCWPGPVLLRCGSGQPDGLSRQFPAGNRDWALNSEGRVFSCPAHPFTREVLARVSAPLIGLIGPESSGVYESAGEDLTLLIRTSENRFESPPTVVATEGNELIVERAGVVSAVELQFTNLLGELEEQHSGEERDVLGVPVAAVSGSQTSHNKHAHTTNRIRGRNNHTHTTHTPQTRAM